jgi:hypothetical protein
LIKVAETVLKPAWQQGSAADVQAAMSGFIATYTRDILVHAPYAPTQQADFRAWSKQFAQWLFGTDHIAVRYEIAYDGVDIRKLSPGTRGIVLLLLYLALDDGDDRPLIIDQPEEESRPEIRVRRTGVPVHSGQGQATGHHGDPQRQPRHQHGCGPDHHR